MTLLDSYAVLAFLKGEPAEGAVGRLLEAGQVSLTALGVAEVVDHLVRIVGIDEEDAVLDVAQVRLGSPDPVDAELALRAGLLRARHYHRRTRAVSLADCVLAEEGRRRREAVATADPHLLELCTDESIAVTPLPDSQGHMWLA